MQQVLHYSALQTGVAYVALTLSIIVFANVSQALALRVGIRRLLPTGLAARRRAGSCSTRGCRCEGHYFWDLFPPFVLSGIGMAFAFIPMTIGALAGVKPSEAGIASGLINTSQQIGGAIGVAVATTIAATYTGRYVGSHPGAGPADGRGAHARLRDRVLRARGARRARRAPRCRPRRVEPRPRRGRRRGARAEHGRLTRKDGRRRSLPPGHAAPPGTTDQRTREERGRPEMQKRFLTVAAVVAAAAVVTATALSSAPPVGPLPKGPVQTVKRSPGTMFTLTLPKPGVAGRSWRVARSYDSGVVRQVGEGTKPSGAVWATLPGRRRRHDAHRLRADARRKVARVRVAHVPRRRFEVGERRRLPGRPAAAHRQPDRAGGHGRARRRRGEEPAAGDRRGDRLP